jgi:hypothetical protein
VLDVRSIKLLLILSFCLIDAVELAIHSSEFVTPEIFGRGTDAYLRQDMNDV